MRRLTNRLMGWTTLALLAVTLAAVERPAWGDETQAPAASGKKILGRKMHRLPRHYKEVGVTEKQREEISKVQDEYQPKIEALQAQLKKLKEEMAAKIAAVLTPEQKKKLDQAEAKPKKTEQEAPPPVKPEEPPAAPPAAPKPTT
jgi:Spy/CpxP family protein refolding chaperone